MRPSVRVYCIVSLKILATRIPVSLIAVFIIFILSSSQLLSQELQTINLEEIPQRQVRRYIENREINYMKDFAVIKSSWKEGTDKSGFHFHEKSFFLKDDLSSVWDCYKNADPTKSWNGHFVRFGLLISKGTNDVVYLKNNNSPEINVGQVYFLDLRLLRGLFNVPVAFEIINIDPAVRIMEFSYLDGNKSQGKQTIQFTDNGDGRIRITHRSYFKSNSILRDSFLYPYFHKKFIKEFHRNMKQVVRDRPLTL